MKIFKKIGMLALLLVVIAGLLGCGKKTEETELNQQTEKEETTEEEIDTFDINNYPIMKENMNEIEALLKKAGIEGEFKHSFATFKNDEKKYDGLDLTFNDKTKVSITFNENQEVKNIYLYDNHSPSVSPSGEFINAMSMLVDYSKLNLTENNKTDISSLWVETTIEGIQKAGSTKNISFGNYKYTFMYFKDTSSTFIISINQ